MYNFNIKFVEVPSPEYGIGLDYKIEVPSTPGIYYGIPPETDPHALKRLKRRINELINDSVDLGSVPAGIGRTAMGGIGHHALITIPHPYWAYKYVMDAVYESSINPIRQDHIHGFCLWGCKIVIGDRALVTRINEAFGLMKVTDCMYHSALESGKLCDHEQMRYLKSRGIIQDYQDFDFDGGFLIIKLHGNFQEFIINTHNLERMRLELRAGLLELPTPVQI